MNRISLVMSAGLALSAVPLFGGVTGFSWPQARIVLADGVEVGFPTNGAVVAERGLVTTFRVVEKPRWSRAFFTVSNATDRAVAPDRVVLFEDWIPPADGKALTGEQIGDSDGSVLVYPTSGLFAAVEHPMAKQTGFDGHYFAHVPIGTPLRPGETRTWSVVVGAYAPGQLRRDFQTYLEAERAHPYRVFPHYNSWFDINFGRSDGPVEGRINEAETLGVMRAFRDELARRGVTLNSYLWDDGWDDWDSLWDFHAGFPNGFRPLADEAHRTPGCSVGVWMSPCGGYNESCRRRVANAARLGLAKADDSKLKLSNPVYYAAFRDRVLQMIRDYDLNIFKFDRIGGGTVHKELKPEHVPEAEAMLRLVEEIRAAKPDTFVNATVGTWASPFWLHWVDSVWRGGWDFYCLGTGTGRQRWLTYRDDHIHDRVASKNPLFPLNSMMSHGVIVSTNSYPAMASCADTDESYRDFRDEVWTSVASGTALQELYVTAGLMAPRWWDALADGIRFLRENEPVLRDTHWIGGDPFDANGDGEVYGYASWRDTRGVIVLRNPTSRRKVFARTLDDLLELPDAWKGASVTEAKEVYGHGVKSDGLRTTDGLATFTMDPYAVVVLAVGLRAPDAGR